MIHRYLQIPGVWVKEDSDTVMVFGSNCQMPGNPKEMNLCPATLLARYKPADIRRVSGRFPLENSPVGTDSVLGCFSTPWYWIESLWFTLSFNLGPVEGPFRDWPSSWTRGATGRNHPASYPLRPPPIAGARPRSEPAVRFPY